MLQLVLDARLAVFVTAQIAAEYEAALGRESVGRLLSRKGVTFADAAIRVARVVTLASVVEPVGDAPWCRDENDRMYLHCAVAARADFLVTNDDDLLVESGNHPFAIVRPAEFLELLRAGAGASTE